MLSLNFCGSIPELKDNVSTVEMFLYYLDKLEFEDYYGCSPKSISIPTVLSKHILNFTTYEDFKNMIHGVQFLETLNRLYRNSQDGDIIFKIKETLPVYDYDNYNYLAHCNNDPLRDNIDWGISIRHAWFNNYYQQKSDLKHLNKPFITHFLQIDSGYDLNNFFIASLINYKQWIDDNELTYDNIKEICSKNDTSQGHIIDYDHDNMINQVYDDERLDTKKYFHFNLSLMNSEERRNYLKTEINEYYHSNIAKTLNLT